MTYTTTGKLSGDCGHEHETIDDALRCILRDCYACVSKGKYSDREIIRREFSDQDQQTHDYQLNDQEKAELKKLEQYP